MHLLWRQISILIDIRDRCESLTWFLKHRPCLLLDKLFNCRNVPSISYSKFAGGKGLNQSIALAKAGMVTHLGSVGEDGYFLRDLLDKRC